MSESARWRHLEERLLARQEQLHDRILRIDAEARRGLPDDPVFQPPSFDRAHERELLGSQRRHAEHELAYVEAALQRMDIGIYGLCVECRTEIDSWRLEARPEITLCLACQRFMEG